MKPEGVRVILIRSMFELHFHVSLVCEYLTKTNMHTSHKKRNRVLLTRELT
ncbi:hypothetical protein BVRB_5g104350 [Beta vulgaris subsp. vulgaris]|nr:hypothetical protein BVRB_5g104350 [Beta vulgaris subsp. vulgaris]